MTVATAVATMAHTLGQAVGILPPKGPRPVVTQAKYNAYLANHTAWAQPLLEQNATYKAAINKLAEVTNAARIAERDRKRGFGREFIKDIAGPLLDGMLAEAETAWTINGAGETATDAHTRANSLIVEFICDKPLPEGKPTRSIDELETQWRFLMKAIPILERRREEARTKAARELEGELRARYAPIVQRAIAALRELADAAGEEDAFMEALRLSDLSLEPIYFSSLIGAGDSVTNPSSSAAHRILEAERKGYI